MLAKLFNPTSKRGDVVLQKPSADFIPYACHFDNASLLTKNGELMQTIKIIGFSGQQIGAKVSDLREEIRKAVGESIPNSDFALWFHTVRRIKNLDPGGDFPTGFAKNLNNEWKSKHRFAESYVNEVYITVIRDGISTKLFEGNNFLQSLWFPKLKRYHIKQLERMNKELHAVVGKMLSSLKDFGAHRLEIRQTDGISYSEQLQFIGKIINLNDAIVPVPIADISDYIRGSQMAFGFNTMQVQNQFGKKFAALFTIKEYHELKGHVLDRFLQLPQEFIITQTLDFVNSNQALKTFTRQKQILEISGDEVFMQQSGLKDITDSAKGKETDYGEGQITIMLMEPSLQGLERNTQHASKILESLGIVVTRRDLRMEECFWAQLPANFSSITRKQHINTSRVGGFASLYNFPAGQKDRNHWGTALTLFHTVAGTPYFFNFHKGDNGHTAIIGPKGAGKTVLLNFLLSESRKYSGRVFFFDQERASKVFIRAIGGHYTVVDPKKSSEDYAFNPLLIEDSAPNRVFLLTWLAHLAQAHGTAINEKDKQQLMEAVNYLYTLPQEERRLSNIANKFGKISKNSLGERMSHWHSKGKYAHLFDNERKNILPFDKSDVYGFGVSRVVKNKVCLGPVLAYLFHRIEMSLDGKPTIVVLDEAWSLVNNNMFAPKLSIWLDRLKARNAMVIFATETIPDSIENLMTQTVSKHIATKIFLPNLNASDSSKAYKKIWGLSDQEFQMLSSMSARQRQFMLKYGEDAIVAVLNLAKMKELHVLSGSDKTARMMDESVIAKGENPDEWLPEFYKKMGISESED